MNHINYYCEHDKIVLWWEKPYEATPDWYYTIKHYHLVSRLMSQKHHIWQWVMVKP